MGIPAFAQSDGRPENTAPNTIRIATYNTELSRKGPGLLLRDITRGKDEQVRAVADVIATIAPDILLLTNIDYDHGLQTLGALRDVISGTVPIGEKPGVHYPYMFARRPNTGMATGLDMDGDGRLGRARDAQGFGYFAGQGGMAILSRYPIRGDDMVDLSALLWADFPGALRPMKNGALFPSDDAFTAQRLSSTGHWVVPIDVGDGGTITLLTYHAGPPVFDGPEDRNGKRNHDETRLWRAYLDGAFGPSPQNRFVILGDANLDPNDGDGLHRAMIELLGDPRIRDPRPQSDGARAAADKTHRGDPRFDTVDWPGITTDNAKAPGNLRVDYVLPSADFVVHDKGVFWPPPETDQGRLVATASRHRLVWVDVATR